MLRAMRVLWAGIALTLISVLMLAPLHALAATTVSYGNAAKPQVIITEVQTTGSSASQEFVELYNTTDSDIDFADTTAAVKAPWKLQFFSASSVAAGMPDWTKPSATVSLTGTIAAHDYYVVAATGYAPGGIDADQSYNSRLSDAGGGLQLVTSTPTAVVTYDRVMWKQGATGQDLPSGVNAAPAAGGSLQRLPNDDSEYVNADNSLTAFAAETTISPKDMWQPPAPANDNGPVDMPADGSTATPADPLTSDPGQPLVNDTDQSMTEVPPIDPATLTPPYITELLANPAEPQTDAHDEFIELFNTNDAPFDLKGYTLEVGTTTLHDFTFTSSTTINPQSYLALFSADTGLSLSNSGGQARLLDVSGATVSQTDSYAEAADNTAWVLVDGTWQWSTTPTPNLPNIITAPAPKVTTKPGTPGSGSKTATTKKATAKTASVKVKGVSATKTKKAKTTATKTKKTPKTKLTTVADAAAIQPKRAPIHAQILVVVAALAVLYAGYEYRTDISNRIHKFGTNRAVRKLLRRSA